MLWWSLQTATSKAMKLGERWVGWKSVEFGSNLEVSDESLRMRMYSGLRELPLVCGTSECYRPLGLLGGSGEGWCSPSRRCSGSQLFLKESEHLLLVCQVVVQPAFTVFLIGPNGRKRRIKIRLVSGRIRVACVEFGMWEWCGDVNLCGESFVCLVCSVYEWCVTRWKAVGHS